MALLAEYSITPDVWDLTSYSSEEVCGLYLETVRELMLVDGLVRDLRSGEWSGLLTDSDRCWHRRAKELVKKLAIQGRLLRFPPKLSSSPTTDSDWCQEALATHEECPLSGAVLVTPSLKQAHSKQQIVVPVDKLKTADCYTCRGAARLPRTIEEYRLHLDPIVRCANSVLFIDPHIDLGRRGYSRFVELLNPAAGRNPAPTIEIHRVCWRDSSDKRMDSAYVAGLVTSFTGALEDFAKKAGLRVEVFFWDDLHDRYLISNLMGILVPNGFDTTADPRSLTTWTRLTREASDDVWREHDPASNRHRLEHHFVIG